MEESTDSCAPLKRDDIKVSIKYFFLTMRTTQKTPKDHKPPPPKPWLLVYSTAFLAVTTTRCCHHHHVTPKQLQVDRASQCYLTEQKVMVAAGTQKLLQCTPNINKQCLLANAFQGFFFFFFCFCCFDSPHDRNLIIKVHFSSI